MRRESEYLQALMDDPMDAELRYEFARYLVAHARAAAARAQLEILLRQRPEDSRFVALQDVLPESPAEGALPLIVPRDSEIRPPGTGLRLVTSTASGGAAVVRPDFGGSRSRDEVTHLSEVYPDDPD